MFMDNWSNYIFNYDGDSFHGARAAIGANELLGTVITNLFSAIPIVGKKYNHWLWGGLSA